CRLTDESKKILVTSVCLACSDFTAAYYSYTQQVDRTIYPDGGVMTWSRDIQEQSPTSTRVHTEVIAAIRAAELDKREYVLLKIMLVCNDELEGLATLDRERIRKLKNECFKTLRVYVFKKRGSEGPAFFGRILSILQVVNRNTNWKKHQHLLI
ncbi:hypothetical protein PMAYCL1PPCAC_28304, partial [Pristionchus mayeri]